MASANVTNTYVVPTATTVAPYYDDFNESKNFHRVLFRPGYAVQARELTQLQTILQNQIERFGRHIFENGSPVIGGEVNIPTHGYDTIKLQANYNDQAITITDFIDQTIVLQGTYDNVSNTYSEDDSVRFRVIAVTAGNSNDPPSLYGSYNGTGKFEDNATVMIQGKQVFATLIETDSQTLSSLAFIRDAIFFFNGYFVKVPAQAAVIGKYTTTPYCKVGLEWNDAIVTEQNDTTLLDPAQDTSNYQAPGAARYQITLTLTSRALTSEDTSKFIELARVENGQLRSQTQFPIYSEIEEVLARRTYDESGNYTVSPFGISFTSDDADPVNYYKAKLSPGKAYIMGYEFQTISDSEIRIPKARSTQNVGYYDFNLNYGNYVIVDGVNGLFDTSNAAMFDIHCVQTNQIDLSSPNTYAQSKIGTAKLNYINYYGATNPLDVSARQYEFYLFDTQYTPIKGNVLATLGQSTGNVNSTIFTSNVADTILYSNVQEEHVYSNVLEEYVIANVVPNTIYSNANVDYIYSNANTVTVFSNVELQLEIGNVASEYIYVNADPDMVYSNGNTAGANYCTVFNYQGLMAGDNDLYVGGQFIIVEGPGEGYEANITSFIPATGRINLDTNFATRPNGQSLISIALRPKKNLRVYDFANTMNLNPVLYEGAQVLIEGPTPENYIGNVVSYNEVTGYLELDANLYSSTDYANAYTGESLISLFVRPLNAIKIFDYSTVMNLEPELYVGASIIIEEPNGNNYSVNVIQYEANSGYLFVDESFWPDIANAETAITDEAVFNLNLRPTNAIKIYNGAELLNLEPTMYEGAQIIIDIPEANSIVANVVSYNADIQYAYTDVELYTLGNYEEAPSLDSLVSFALRPKDYIKIWDTENLLNLDESLYINAELVVNAGNGEGYIGNVVSYNVESQWLLVDVPFDDDVDQRPAIDSLISIRMRPLGAVKIANATELLTEDPSYYVNSIIYITESAGAGYEGYVSEYNAVSQYFYVDTPLPDYGLLDESLISVVTRRPDQSTIRFYDPANTSMVYPSEYYVGSLISITANNGNTFFANVTDYDANSQIFALDNSFGSSEMVPLGNSTAQMLIQTPHMLKLYSNANVDIFDENAYSNAKLRITSGPSGGYIANVVSYDATTRFFTLEEEFSDYRMANSQVDILMQIDDVLKLQNSSTVFDLDPIMYANAIIQINDGPGSGYTGFIASYNAANQRFGVDTPFPDIRLSNTNVKITLQLTDQVRLYDTANLLLTKANSYTNASIVFDSGPAEGYSGNITSYNAVSQFFTLNSNMPGVPGDNAVAYVRLQNPNNSVTIYNFANTMLFQDYQYQGSIFQIISGSANGFAANIVSYDANTGVFVFDRDLPAQLPDLTSVVRVSITGANNVVKLYDSANLLTQVAGAYTGATLRVLDGPANGLKFNITNYDPATNTIFLSSALPEHPTGNVAIEFDFAEAKSFYISTAYTPGGSNLSADANARITSLNKTNNSPTGSSFILEPTLSTLLFKLPNDWIAANMSYSSYSYTKRYDRDIVGGQLTYNLIANTNENFLASTSMIDYSSDVLDNLFVVCTDRKNSSRANGEIIKVRPTVSNGIMQLQTSNASESFSAAIFTKIELSSPTQPKTKIFVAANTSTMSEALPVTLEGWGTGSIAELYLDAGQIVITNPSNQPSKEETLYVSDVVGVEKIYDLNGGTFTAGDPIEGFADVTSYYSFDNGQRDTHYDHASIRLKPNFKPPVGPLLVCFYYFKHQKENQGSGYFSVDSYFRPNPYTANVYSGINGTGRYLGDGYAVIPEYIKSDGSHVELRDCLDFRPTRKNGSNSSPNYEFTDVDAPSPASDIGLSYSYYWGRKDLIVLTGDRQFQRVEGLPAKYPVEPSVPARTMVLYSLDIPPYTEFSSNIAVKLVDNRRYTMRDIGRIDKRVENLEYYVSLNTLEKKAIDTSITDVNGVERTKYGIFVDSFDGHSLGAKDRTDYHCSMNLVAGYMSSQVTANNFKIKANTETSTNIVITRDKILLPYIETNFLSQTDATKTTPLNDFIYGVFNGTIVTQPESDIAKSYINPEMLNTDSSKEAPLNDFYNSIDDIVSRTYK